MQQNSNYYMNVIERINSIMGYAYCKLPEGFANRWANGQNPSDKDITDFKRWVGQIGNTMDKIPKSCRNIRIANQMGQDLLKLNYTDSYGPLKNYYNACLWTVSFMLLDMLEDILCTEQQFVGEATFNKQKIKTWWNMKGRKTKDDAAVQFKLQTKKMQNKCKTFMTYYQKSRQNNFEPDRTVDGYLFKVYNSKFLKEKMQYLNKYGEDIDKHLKR